MTAPKAAYDEADGGEETWSDAEIEANLDAQYDADQAYWASPAGEAHQLREFRASRQSAPSPTREDDA